MLALMLLGGAARAAEALCVSMAGVVALVSPQGEALIVPGSVSCVFPIGNSGLFAAGSPGDYALYDAQGERLSEERFAMIDSEDDALIFRQNGLYGAMDFSGALRVAPVWTQLTASGDGDYLALEGDPLDDQPDEILHLDAEGMALDTGSATVGGLRPVRENRMPYEAADGRYGCVDGQGRAAIPPVWRYIAGFEGGLAIAADASGRGVIDADGGIVVPMEYAALERSDAMIAGLTDDGRLDVYAADGSALVWSVQAEATQFALVGDCLALWDGAGAALMNARGDVVCEASPLAAFLPGLNGQVIVSDGEGFEAKQWLIDADGRVASEAHQRILPLYGDRYAYITMNGVEYYSPELDMLQKSWDYDSLRYGLMDGAGRRLLSAEYLEIRGLGADRMLIETAYEVQMTDLDGAPIAVWAKPETGAAS